MQCTCSAHAVHTQRACAKAYLRVEVELLHSGPLLGLLLGRVHFGAVLLAVGGEGLLLLSGLLLRAGLVLLIVRL